MAGLTYDGIPSTEIDSSNFSGTTFYSSVISGVNTRFTSGTFPRVSNVDGVLFSDGVGSPITYSAFVQAGKSGPLLAATGSLVFGRQFANQTFVVTVSPSESGTLPWSVASGNTTYTISGITVNGQSGLSFHWMAVGV